MCLRERLFLKVHDADGINVIKRQKINLEIVQTLPRTDPKVFWWRDQDNQKPIDARDYFPNFATRTQFALRDVADRATAGSTLAAPI